MNGVHDMGGMDGFGKVEATPSEPPFHEIWEGRVLALNRVMQSTVEWNIDVARYWTEILPPDVYLASSYYKKWFLRLENLCLAKGLVSHEELVSGHSTGPGRPLKGSVVTAVEAGKTLVRGNYDLPPTAPARFHIGDRVRAKNIHPKSHTRLPAVRARAYGCGRAHRGLPRLSRRSGRGGDRASGVVLHGDLREPRALGARCRPDGAGVSRGIRILSRCGVMTDAHKRRSKGDRNRSRHSL